MNKTLNTYIWYKKYLRERRKSIVVSQNYPPYFRSLENCEKPPEHFRREGKIDSACRLGRISLRRVGHIRCFLFSFFFFSAHPVPGAAPMHISSSSWPPESRPSPSIHSHGNFLNVRAAKLSGPQCSQPSRASDALTFRFSVNDRPCVCARVHVCTRWRIDVCVGVCV